MGETKWVPGPWRLGLVSDTTVQTLDGKIVAEVDGDYNQPELWPIMEANARLIAAAPEMYAALEAVPIPRPISGWPGDDIEAFLAAFDAFKKLRDAAMQKARGETP